MTTRYQRPPESTHYPTHWNEVADVRVLKTKPGEWHKLSMWRADMARLQSLVSSAWPAESE